MKLPRFLLKLHEYFKNHLALEEVNMDGKTTKEHLFDKPNKMTEKKKGKGTKDKTKVKMPSTPSTNSFADPRSQRFEAWWDSQRIPAAEEVPVRADMQYLLDTHDIDVLAAPEIVSLFIAHRAEHVHWKVVRSLAETFRYVPDSTQIYPAIAHYFESQIPITQRHYGSKLKPSDLDAIRKHLLDGSLTDTLSTYRPVFRRELPRDSDHKKQLASQALLASSTSSLINEVDSASFASTQASSEKKDKKRKREAPELSSSPRIKQSTTPGPDQRANQETEYPSEHSTVGFDATFSMHRSKLKMKRLQSLERLERERVNIDQEIISVEKNYHYESKMLDQAEDHQRKELENAGCLARKFKKD